MNRSYFLLLTLLTCLVSCSDKDDVPFPNLITEMSMAHANSQGLLARFVTDGGREYHVSNEIKGMEANETLRALIGYAVESDGRAKVYSAQSVPVLPDATGKTAPLHDPINVESIWVGGGFINMHLLPKTQGEKQGWAFLRDSTRTNVLGGQTHHLSLLHHQQEDPTSYSRHLYVCVDLDSVAPSLSATDSITFVVHTFSGPQAWHFGKF